MLIIQFILITIIALIVLRLIFKLKSGELTSQQFALWLVIWLVAIVVIGYPKITSQLASRVGVTRGVDLVVYTSIILIFYILFRLLMRLNKIEDNITKIARQVALEDKDKD